MKSKICVLLIGFLAVPSIVLAGDPMSECRGGGHWVAGHMKGTGVDQVRIGAHCEGDEHYTPSPEPIPAPNPEPTPEPAPEPSPAPTPDPTPSPTPEAPVEVQSTPSAGSSSSGGGSNDNIGGHRHPTEVTAGSGDVSPDWTGLYNALGSLANFLKNLLPHVAPHSVWDEGKG